MSGSEANRYTSISPATDWFFVHGDANPAKPPTVWRLAAWGIAEDGKVIGLIGAFGEELGRKGVPHLISVPPVPGTYLHWTQLSETEAAQSLKR